MEFCRESPVNEKQDVETGVLCLVKKKRDSAQRVIYNVARIGEFGIAR